MRPPVARHRNRLLLAMAAAVFSLSPALLTSTSPAWASTTLASASTTPSGNSTTTTAQNGAKTSPGITPADTSLDALMLATPLPGLISFGLVGPGATNGPLTAQTLGSYSNDPHQVEHLFDQYSSESGFAGWIKTWQDNTGTSLVVEIAIRFHAANEATTNASAFVSTLSNGISGGNRTHVPSIPGAIAFTIDEPATTSGNITIPAQQVQAVVFADGKYLIALHTDSPNSAKSQPIAAGTAIALALQQYQVLSPPTLPSAAKTHGKSASSGSTIEVVGIIMLVAVAIVIAAIAFVSWRRRQSDTNRSSTPTTRPRRAEGGETAKGNEIAEEKVTEREGGRRWPETVGPVGAPNGSGVAATTNGQEEHIVGRDKVGQGKVGQGKKRVSLGPLGRTPKKPVRGVDDQQLVQAGAPSGSGSRSQRIANSRTKHPSASVALARARPPNEAAGWYNDPTDSQNRRIRYWDGGSWTSHVAEPEI
jgi:hypothetical protein